MELWPLMASPHRCSQLTYGPVSHGAVILSALLTLKGQRGRLIVSH